MKKNKQSEKHKKLRIEQFKKSIIKHIKSTNLQSPFVSAMRAINRKK